VNRMRRIDDPHYIEKCLAGELLYGDDLSVEELEIWFRGEEEGYFTIEQQSGKHYEYPFHALDWEHGFRFLAGRTFNSVLGVGSAFGDEFRPIIRQCRQITVLEPAKGFARQEIDGVPVRYVPPDPTGRMPFADASFDLITCFSVLHHVANVSFVLKELHRCLRPDGVLLVREPAVSMGDWRRPRTGLTRRERGIPPHLFRRMILDAGFEIVREKRCAFSLMSRFKYLLGQPAYNSRFVMKLDKLVCRLPIWSRRYHPRIFLHKLCPTMMVFVLRRG